jgi:hypothetical protein
MDMLLVTGMRYMVCWTLHLVHNIYVGHGISNRYEVHGMMDIALGAQCLYVVCISNRYEVHGMLVIYMQDMVLVTGIW